MSSINQQKGLVSANSTISLAEMLGQQAKAREIPVSLTDSDYAEAVNLLVKLAQRDCGGSRVAAQVLLGTYNGNHWHMNLVDLTNLDAEHYRAAIIVIRCRVEIWREPHEMIDDGDAIFEALADDWMHYHVKRRYQEQ
jgi:hypothetical protein